MHTTVKSLTFALIVSLTVLAGCSVFSQQTLYSGDITGDGNNDRIRIEKSDVALSDEAKEAYSDSFVSLVISSRTDGEQRELLRIDEAGVTVEDGNTVGAGIATQAAYAIDIEYIGEAFDKMYIVQIDESGVPVSEPLTISWNAEQGNWRFQ